MPGASIVVGAPATAEDIAVDASLAPDLTALVPASMAEDAALVALDMDSFAESWDSCEQATTAAPEIASAAATAPVRFIAF
ncbi:hypothetical protein GCM10010409_05870 [Mycolicibacterium diernhoferi]